MIDGSILGVTALLVVGIWFLYGGLNVPVRAWQITRYEAAQEAYERIQVAVPKRPMKPLVKMFLKELGWTTNLFFAVIVLTLVRVSFYSADIRSLSLGLLIGVAGMTLLWAGYRQSRTYRSYELRFDRVGVTVFPPRQMLAARGAYQYRIDWKDCTGYWVHRDNVMLGLRPVGQFELTVGDSQADVEAILHRLGLRKLVSYDVREVGAWSEQQLSALEHRVLTMADEVIAGYGAEQVMLGSRIVAEVERRQAEDRFGVLVLHQLVDGESAQDLEWLIWGEDPHHLETLGLPDDRLYEGLDERVASLLESRKRELGHAERPLVLQ